MSAYDESHMAALAGLLASKEIALQEAGEEIDDLKEKLKRLDGAMGKNEIETLFALQAKRGEIVAPMHDKRKKGAPIFDLCFVQNDPAGSQRITTGPIILAEFLHGDEQIRVCYRVTFTPFVSEK